jgi:cyclopropane fatty-acyl-phospholipid synthase-like methyltransferase
LHKEKHDVLAVDSCEFMLSVFRNKLGEGSGPRIIHADFETFATQETFDGIVALNATQFLLNANQVKDFFQKVHGLLGNGGVFLFTAPNPLAQWEPSGWSAVVSREFENGFARREASFQPVNKLKGLVKVSDYKVLCVGDNCSIDYYSKMIRLYTLTEYKLLLHQAGFNNIAINVDQDQGVSQLSKDALKMYISATK